MNLFLWCTMTNLFNSAVQYKAVNLKSGAKVEDIYSVIQDDQLAIFSNLNLKLVVVDLIASDAHYTLTTAFPIVFTSTINHYVCENTRYRIFIRYTTTHIPPADSVIANEEMPNDTIISSHITTINNSFQAVIVQIKENLVVFQIHCPNEYSVSVPLVPLIVPLFKLKLTEPIEFECKGTVFTLDNSSDEAIMAGLKV